MKTVIIKIKTEVLDSVKRHLKEEYDCEITGTCETCGFSENLNELLVYCGYNPTTLITKRQSHYCGYWKD